MKRFALVCAITLFSAGFSSAQQATGAATVPDTAALEQKIRDLEDRIVALEGQMRVMKAQAAQAPAAAAPAAPSAESTTQSAAAAAPVETIAPTQTQVTLGGAG